MRCDLDAVRELAETAGGNYDMRLHDGTKVNVCNLAADVLELAEALKQIAEVGHEFGECEAAWGEQYECSCWVKIARDALAKQG